MCTNFSFWEQETFLKGYDVLILGSGIVGLNAALHLKKQAPDLKIAIIERGMLPSGASTKNAGFACFGSISELIEQLKSSSEEEVAALAAFRWKGLQRLLSTLGSNAIDLQNLGGYELFSPDDQLLFEECADKISYFNKLFAEAIGHDIYAVADEKISAFGFGNTAHLILNRYEGQIDTGRMMKALLEKVQLEGVIFLNGVNVTAVEQDEEGYRLRTDNNITLKGKKVLLATNAFASQLLPGLDVIPGRGQVLITKPVPGLKLQGTFHYDKGFYYFRNINGRVLLGGGRNLDIKAEETWEQGNTALIRDALENLLRKVILPYTSFEIDYAWSGIMAFGSELQPVIKEVKPGLVCAVRCNGMGVAMGSLVGEEAAELVLQQL